MGKRCTWTSTLNWKPLLIQTDYTQSVSGAASNDGAGWEPIGDHTYPYHSTFTGTFNGNGKTIKGLFINRPSADKVGLFGSIDGATIQGVRLEDVSINGEYRVGGLVGINYDSIENSYATGTVTGNMDNVGGLVGYNDSSLVTDSYYNKQTTGQSDTGKGEPKTSAEMATKSTFINDWDFENAWNIKGGQSYPYLQWSTPDPLPSPPSVTEVTVNPSALTFDYGGNSSTTVTATVNPTDAIDTTVTWSSSNTGVVTPVGVGTTTITATSNGNGNISGQATVTVNKIELSIDGTFTAEDKTYDGSASATIDTNNLTLSGVIDGDDVTLNPVAEFSDADAGHGKTVSLAASSSLNGDDAGNYTLSLAGSPTTTADIISRNADLSSLSLSSGTLNLAFDASTTSYTVSASNNVSSITVTPTADDVNATITINGAEVPSGQTSGNVALSVGSNTINVEVTAEDPFITKTYTITVTRASASSGGSDNGGGGSDRTTSIISGAAKTAGDKALGEALTDTDKALLNLAENDTNSAEISSSVIKTLTEHNETFIVENTGVRLGFDPGSLNTEQVTDEEDANVEICAKEIQGQERQDILTNTPPGESTGLFEISGQMLNGITLPGR